MAKESIITESLKRIEACTDLKQLEQLKAELLGRQGQISTLLKQLGQMSPEERQIHGPILNGLKNQINSALEAKIAFFKNQAKQALLSSQRVDISLPMPPLPITQGHLHPITKTMQEVNAIFTKMGFDIAAGSDIETDYYNFTALNFPPHHPARAMHDTFFLNTKDAKGNPKLLRTHTSPVQIHAMECMKPPLRIIIPGKTYRMDYDATHTPMFHQLEGLVIDKQVTMAHLRWVLEEFCKEFFETSHIKMRFRPSFFPFTEPSMEVDISCENVNNGKWLEIIGCGMVHPNVLTNGGLNPEIYQGFAWGVGIERLTMLKYGISDLRAFFEPDIEWLRHYGFSPISADSQGRPA